MRKRKHQIIFRLTDNEVDRLRASVAATGLSTEAYLRQLISGQVPKALPPAEYYAMMQEVYKLEALLRQLRDDLFDREQRVEADRMEATRQEVVAAIRGITRAALEPAAWKAADSGDKAT